MTEAVESSIDARGIANIILNRPAAHNAVDAPMIAALANAFQAAAADPTVRAVLLTGKGKSFCAGADLHWMRDSASQPAEAIEADAMRLSDMLAAIDNCPKPILLVAQGAVYGVGIGLVACADLAVALPSTKFCLNEVRLGLTPAVIAPFVIRTIGARNARRYFLTAELFDAVTAHDIDLITELADDEAGARAWVDAWLDHILAAAPGAVTDAKALVRDFAGRPVDTMLRAEAARRSAARRVGAEAREGLSARLGKHKPRWSRNA